MNTILSKKNFREKKWMLIIFVILWIVFIVRYPVANITQIEIEPIAQNTGVIDEITEGMTVTQHFLAKKDHFAGIGLLMATYNRDNSSQLEVSVSNEKGEKVYDQIINASEISDTAYYVVNFEDIGEACGESFTITVKSLDANEGNGITIYKTDESVSEDTYVTVNNDTQQYNLSYQLIYNNYWYKYVIMGMYLLIFMISLLVLLSLNNDLNKNFLKIALLGSLLIILNPFPHVLDESTHFFRSFCIAQGNLTGDWYNGQIGEWVSSNFLASLQNKLTIQNLVGNFSDWNQKFSSEKIFYQMKYMSSYLPINHSIAAIGIAIFRLVQAPIFLVIWGGRLADYIVYVLFTYWAIKEAKYYKSFFFCVALLPIAIFIGTSISLDMFLYASSLLLLSICMKYYFDKEVNHLTKKDSILLIVCVISIASVKYLIYCPLLLMFFFIPKEKFKSKKQYWIILAAALVIILIMLIWQLDLLHRFPYIEDRNGDVDVGRQIQYIFSNIKGTIKVFLFYMIEEWYQILQSVNIYQGFSIIGTIGFWGMLFNATITSDKYLFEDKKNKKIFMWAMAMITFIILGLIVASLYVGFTPVGANNVQGIQPRYFIPIMVPGLLCLSNIAGKHHIKNYNMKLSFLMMLGIVNLIWGILVI